MHVTPNASVTAVQHILLAFNGYGQPPWQVKTPWLVSFPDGHATSRAILLINMLKGWTAGLHSEMQNMILIQADQHDKSPAA